MSLLTRFREEIFGIGIKRRSVEGKEDGTPPRSQGDRQGRPYQNTVLFPPCTCPWTGDPGGRPAGRLSACHHHQNLTLMGPA